jgi:hypothetical protein
MYRIIIILLVALIPFHTKGQTQIENSSLLYGNPSTIIPDTLKSFLLKRNPPYLYTAYMSHKEKPFTNKMGRGCLMGLIYNTSIMTGLVLSPTWLSQWDNKSTRFKLNSFMEQYKNSYTKPPVFDHDAFITNYLGHPYQGGFYYNCVRSQGANMLQSSLFCLGQALLWEYVWEAGIEQPSIQDLITTPFAGILVGELSHVATIKMGRHGFNTIEKVVVCVINPSWVMNNKFIFNKYKSPKN